MPDRPPMDGNRTDNIGMMSTNIYLEHGEPDSNIPCMGFYATAWIPRELVYDADGDFVHSHVVSDMQEQLNAAYKAKDGYGCTVEVQETYDTPDSEGRVEVALTCEFWSDNGYDGDESLESWTERVLKNTPFMSVYNRFVLLFTGSEELAEVLRNTKPREEAT